MRSHKSWFVPRWSVAFALAIAAVSGPSFARGIPIIPPDLMLTGPARVVDGDTIELSGNRIRLEGIDAPETGQTCQTAKAETWDCGHAATRMLVALTQYRRVDCKVTGLDKYGRVLAVCAVGAVDINAEMVKRGYAWAFVKYSKLYVAEEAAAHRDGRGIWQGPAVPAWDYRSGKWTAVAPDAPEGCAIKGNVSRSGLIYHMPWSPWYQKVAMSPERGTRWFCTEAEATAAGWRPAMMR